MKKQKIVSLVIAIAASFVTFWCLEKAGVPSENRQFMSLAILAVVVSYDLIKNFVED